MVSTGNPNPPKRGRVIGWTAAAARRNTNFLRSVDERYLDGVGLALTLTLRDCPASSEDLSALVLRWIDRQRKGGMIRLHWVIEWQRRGVPHLHLAVWYDGALVRELPDHQFVEGVEAMQNRSMVDADPEYQHAAAAAVRDWVQLAQPHGANAKAQHARPIEDVVGWFGYMSKHCSRSVRHYQRQRENLPSGWQSTGRMWGRRGRWVTIDPVRHPCDRPTFWRYRRLVQRRRLAEARQALPLNSRQVAHLRRIRKFGDRRLSETRPLSEWIPQDVQAQLMRAAVVCYPADH